jgi:hypothetical protein
MINGIQELLKQGDSARDPAKDDEHGRLVPVGQYRSKHGLAAHDGPQNAKKSGDRKKPWERVSESDLGHEGERNQDCEPNAKSDQDWR